MSRRISKQSKIIRCLKAPGRILAKARNLYVYGMMECSGRLSGSSVMGCPTGQPPVLPRSFSAASSSYDDEDPRELMRASSTRNRMLGISPIDDSTPEPEQKRPPAPRRPATAPRSYSVAFGRIDEDKPCEFGEISQRVGMYPRSRSAYGVPKLRTAGLRREI